MVLARMIHDYEDELICDLAESYGLYDYRQLPADKVAVLSIGLRETSRVKMKLSEQKASVETTLLAGIMDRVGLLVWMQTKDGQKGRNKPSSVLDSLLSEPKEADNVVYQSGEEFDDERNKLLSMLGGND